MIYCRDQNSCLPFAPTVREREREREREKFSFPVTLCLPMLFSPSKSSSHIMIWYYKECRETLWHQNAIPRIESHGERNGLLHWSQCNNNTGTEESASTGKKMIMMSEGIKMENIMLLSSSYNLCVRVAFLSQIHRHHLLHLYLYAPTDIIDFAVMSFPFSRVFA
jgi:hypothetical protein